MNTVAVGISDGVTATGGTGQRDGQIRQGGTEYQVNPVGVV